MIPPRASRRAEGMEGLKEGKEGQPGGNDTGRMNEERMLKKIGVLFLSFLSIYMFVSICPS